jgi:Icc-related predicted phosphoesterase
LGIKLLALTDIHGKISSLTGILGSVLPSHRIDLITISGDISHFGDGAEVERILGHVDQTGIPYCYILGNCDPPDKKGGVNARGKCVQDACASFDGINVAGSGGSMPTPFGTPFEVAEDEIVGNLLRNISRCPSLPPLGALMLISHNPPFGGTFDRTSFGQHVGSRRLKDLILEISPALVQCGHIHEGAGVERMGKSLVFNPGPAMKGRYAIAEIGGGVPNVKLGTA